MIDGMLDMMSDGWYDVYDCELLFVWSEVGVIIIIIIIIIEVWFVLLLLLLVYLLNCVWYYYYYYCFCGVMFYFL